MATGNEQHRGPLATAWQWLRWRLRVTLTLEKSSRSRKVRARTLLVIVALGFVVAGVAHVASPMGLLAESPFDLDYALRTLSAGWFQPHDVVPVTVVEIDDATHRAWGSPAVTPRAALVGLLDTIIRARPAAVVVDIDLAWGGDDPGLPVLRDYLAAYRGPAPLLFPKRLQPGPGGTRRAADSPLDDLFASNPHLAWAHASFESDPGGIVRQWADWLEVCTADGTTLVPSVAERLSLLMEPLPRGLQRASPPPLHGSCRRSDDPPGQLLLVGPRLTGPEREGMTADAASIPALAVLDPALDRDDAWLFGGRVVLIGATHAAAGDFWLTPSGVLPGVELLANTVHFASLRGVPGWRATAAHRGAVLVAFLLFATIALTLRGLAAALAYLWGGLLFVVVPIWIWDYYRVFEALEVGVLLVVAWKFLVTLFDMIEDWKKERATRPAGWRGRLAALWATCRKPETGEGAHE